MNTNLIELSFAGIAKSGHRQFYYKCKCGNVFIALRNSVKTGNTRSCGCLKTALQIARLTTHGMSDSQEYSAWQSMKDRCTNSNNKDYRHYGGRGITVCDEWLDSFEAFLTDMGRVPIDHTLERKETNGRYCKSNCIWATREVQANNRHKRGTH